MTQAIKKITVKTIVNAPIEMVWKFFTEAEHIRHWNYASEDWHTPAATNDLRPGGQFMYRMEAKDGSFGFDFGGIYNEVEEQKKIVYTIGDGRTVSVDFTALETATEVVEIFEAESQHTVEMQQQGWQAILDHFKKYVEAGK